MLYSFPVSPSIVFGAPCRVISSGTAFLCVNEKKNKNSKNNKKTVIYKLCRGKPQKNEDNND